MPTVLDSLITILGFKTDLAALKRFDDRVSATRKRLDGISSSAFTMGREIAVVGGIATTAFGFAVKGAISWESSMTEVEKTVDGTDAQIKQLDKDLRHLAVSTLPVAHSELAQIAAIGGQLGVRVEDVAAFTETIARLDASSDALDAETAATGVAKFINVVGAGIDKADEFSSVLVDLGNNFATNEAQILHGVGFFAAAAKLANVDAAESLGLSAAASDLGLRPEATGSSLARVFGVVRQAVETGNEDLATLSQLTGNSIAELTKSFEQEGGDAVFLDMLKGMQRLRAEGVNVDAILEQLGLTDIRVTRTLFTMAGGVDRVESAIQTSTAAFAENNALLIESDKRFGTSASQVQFAKNQMANLSITVGTILVPALISLINELKPAVLWLERFSGEHPTLVKNIALASVALLALGVTLIAIGAIAKAASIAIAGFQGAVTLVRGAIWLWRNALLATRAQMLLMNIAAIATHAVQLAAAVATYVMTAAQWALNVAMYANPVGLIVLGIVALIAVLVAAGYFVYKFRDQILAGLGAAWNWIKSNWPLLLAILTGPIGLAVWAILRYKDQIIGFFQDVWDFITGIDLFESGRALIQGFWNGILSAKDALIEGVKGIVGDVRDLLPFSDAKTGPLSQLTASGMAFIDTLNSGIRQAGGIDLAQSLLPVGPVPLPQGGGGQEGGGPTFSITIDKIEINVPGGDAEAIGASVQEEVARHMRALVEQSDSQIRA